MDARIERSMSKIDRTVGKGSPRLAHNVALQARARATMSLELLAAAEVGRVLRAAKASVQS